MKKELCRKLEKLITQTLTAPWKELSEEEQIKLEQEFNLQSNKLRNEYKQRL